MESRVYWVYWVLRSDPWRWQCHNVEMVRWTQRYTRCQPTSASSGYGHYHAHGETATPGVATPYGGAVGVASAYQGQMSPPTTPDSVAGYVGQPTSTKTASASKVAPSASLTPPSSPHFRQPPPPLTPLASLTPMAALAQVIALNLALDFKWNLALDLKSIALFFLFFFLECHRLS